MSVPVTFLLLPLFICLFCASNLYTFCIPCNIMGKVDNETLLPLIKSPAPAAKENITLKETKDLEEEVSQWRYMEQCDHINSAIRQQLYAQRYVSVKSCLLPEIFLRQNHLSLIDLFSCQLFFLLYIYNLITLYSLLSMTAIFSFHPPHQKITRRVKILDIWFHQLRSIQTDPIGPSIFAINLQIYYGY